MSLSETNLFPQKDYKLRKIGSDITRTLRYHILRNIRLFFKGKYTIPNYIYDISSILRLTTWSHILHVVVTTSKDGTGIPTAHTRHHRLQTVFFVLGLANLASHVTTDSIHVYRYSGEVENEWKSTMMWYFLIVGWLIFWGSLILYSREDEVAALMEMNCRVELLALREGKRSSR